MAEFEAFLSERFPSNSKRSTSGEIRASFGEEIVGALKSPANVDKSLRFYMYVKKDKFQLSISRLIIIKLIKKRYTLCTLKLKHKVARYPHICTNDRLL